MPYEIRKVKTGSRPFKIVEKDTGKVVGSSETQEQAEKSIAYRENAEGKKNVRTNK